MDYFRKTKDRLMQSVGLQASIPEDPELAQAQQRLKLLYTTVQSQRTSMIQYARSMCMVGEAARKLSDDISRFYSKSQQHQQTVGAFIDASLDQESNALLLFKEQFADDIEHHFDHWLFEIKELNGQCKHLTEHHQHLGNLKLKIENGQKNPSSYQSDQGATGHDGLKHDMQVHMAEEKAFIADKTNAISTVNTMLVQRYTRFDTVFIRLMEFQKDFFADGLEVTQNYAPIVDQYREKNKIAATVPQQPHTHHYTHTQPQQAPSQPKPAQSPPQTQAQAKPEQPSPQQPQTAPQPPKQQTQPTPQPAPQSQPAPQPKEINLFDLDFGANPTTPKPTQSTQSGMLDLLGDQQKSQPQQPQTQDLFGDIFSASPSQTKPAAQPAKTASLEDFFAGSGATTPRVATPSHSHGDGFDSFLATNRKAGAQGVDDIDEDTASKPSPAPPKGDDLLGGFNFASSSNSNNKNSLSGDFDFDPLSSGSSSTKSAPAKKAVYTPEPELPAGPQLSQSEEQAQIIDHKLKLEQRIEQWRYKHGVERDIQGLLSTLHTVLWTGHSWKKVDSTGLLDYGSVKKVFRRALLTVHPDKVSTGNPEMKATADLVFEILNNAFKRYEIQQGLRSA